MMARAVSPVEIKSPGKRCKLAIFTPEGDKRPDGMSPMSLAAAIGAMCCLKATISIIPGT